MRSGADAWSWRSPVRHPQGVESVDAHTLPDRPTTPGIDLRVARRPASRPTHLWSFEPNGPVTRPPIGSTPHERRSRQARHRVRLSGGPGLPGEGKPVRQSVGPARDITGISRSATGMPLPTVPLRQGHIRIARAGKSADRAYPGRKRSCQWRNDPLKVAPSRFCWRSPTGPSSGHQPVRAGSSAG